ncbi:MAG: glycosyltransferase family 2 protein [Solirubrobacterales bacterium]
MTTVTVVMPFLDAERYLEEAIASVEHQSHQDWELLLVDDGSTDASAIIARAAVRRDSRIQLLTRPPELAQGAAVARNIGLKHAGGDLIAFLDADDVFEQRRIESHVEAFRRYPESMVVYGPTRWWHPEAEHRDWTEPMGRMARRVHRPPKLLNEVVLLGRGQVPCTCSVMVRRAALDEVGGFEPFDLYEDQTMWVKLFVRYPVYVSEFVGARYRQHDDSTSARSQRRGDYDWTGPHRARTVFLGWVRNYMEANGIADESIDRALRRAMAVNNQDWTGLSFADRTALVALVIEDRVRGLGRRVQRIRRRIARGVARTSLC